MQDPSSEHRTHARSTMLCLALAAALAACGGGGGGTPGSPPPSPPPPPPPPPAGQDHRISATSLDYDANGTSDAGEVHVYDAQGRLTERRYTYTGDGTTDRQNLYGDRDTTDRLTYDGASARVASQTSTLADGSGWRDRMTYDTGGRPSRTDTETLAAGGAATAAGYTLFEYTGDRLTATVFHLPDGTVGMRQTLTWDAGTGLPVQSRRAFTVGASRTTYEWNSDGSLAAERQDADDDGVFDQITLYSYAGGLLQTAVRTKAGSYAGQPGLTYRFFHDGAGRLERSDVDLGSDGSVDAVHRVTVEAGACQAPVLPVVFPLVTENGYGSSASFEWRAYCSR